MKLFILTITILLSLSSVAGTISDLQGTYHTDDFKIEVMKNGKIKLFNESLFGPHNGLEKSLKESGNSGVYEIEGLPHIIILTGEQVKEANCSADEAQDIAVAAMGAEGIEVYCLTKL